MEPINEKTVNTLSDLIIINNDRYEGYQKAMEQTEDADIKMMFSTMSLQSKANNTHLRALMPADENTPAKDETLVAGKLHRTWMDIKNAVDADNRQEILTSCKQGEEFAKKAYEDALAGRAEMSPDAVTTIQKQYDELLDSYIEVEKLRDTE